MSNKNKQYYFLDQLLKPEDGSILLTEGQCPKVVSLLVTMSFGGIVSIVGKILTEDITPQHHDHQIDKAHIPAHRPSDKQIVSAVRFVRNLMATAGASCRADYRADGTMLFAIDDFKEFTKFGCIYSVLFELPKWMLDLNVFCDKNYGTDFTKESIISLLHDKASRYLPIHFNVELHFVPRETFSKKMKPCDSTDSSSSNKILSALLEHPGQSVLAAGAGEDAPDHTNQVPAGVEQMMGELFTTASEGVTHEVDLSKIPTTHQMDILAGGFGPVSPTDLRNIPSPSEHLARTEDRVTAVANLRDTFNNLLAEPAQDPVEVDGREGESESDATVEAGIPTPTLDPNMGASVADETPDTNVEASLLFSGHISHQQDIVDGRCEEVPPNSGSMEQNTPVETIPALGDNSLVEEGERRCGAIPHTISLVENPPKKWRRRQH